MKTPPITITPNILNLSMRISELLGSISALNMPKPRVGLRKDNKVKTIHGSLAIEGNTLSIEQITDIINERPVFGPKKDIDEVKNAIAVYNDLSKYNYLSPISLLSAHKRLMQGLLTDAGSYRSGNVGIFAGKDVSHVAPSAKPVLRLMSDLFTYLCEDNETSLLIKACVFHYELEFIHPFSDGNGRMGRLWQQLILISFHPIFEFLPIESLIKENQQTYYRILGECDRSGESTSFVQFSLRHILSALETLQNSLRSVQHTGDMRLELAADTFQKKWFTRQDYMKLHKTISSATASRDINRAFIEGSLERQGEKRLSQYRFKCSSPDLI